MKTVNIVQNTEEWEQLRETKIGASDANIIMGESDYCTPKQLWEKKLKLVPKEEKTNTFVTDKGHRIEPKIRAMMEIEYGIDLEPIICLSDAYPYLMASLDGFGTNLSTNISYVLECKYVGQEDFELVKSGKILPQYKPQIMTQLTLTGAKFCILAVATENKEDLDEKTNKPRLKFTHVLIEADLNYIKDNLLPALHAFWHTNILEKKQPKLSYDDILVDDSNEYLSDALIRYDLVLKEQEEVAARVEKIKKEIFDLAKHDKVICNGIKVYTVRSKPSETKVYDYEGFLKASNLELPETYISLKIGKGSTSKQIKFPKPEESKPAEEMIVKGASIAQPDPAFIPSGDDFPEKSTPTTPTKRKRRTKAEIEADKLAASQQ